jgi:PAS domain S-box-containing protein
MTANAAFTCEHIFNVISNGVIATDAHGRITHINRQAETILGFHHTRHTGAFISDLLPLTGPHVMRCLKTGQANLGQHIKGRSVDLVLNITLICEDDAVLGAACSFQELRQFERTARKLESYKQMNRQLEAIFKASSDGIWVCDRQGRVISVNEASERLNGIRATDIVGRNVADLMEMGLFDRSVTLEVLATGRQVSVMQYIQRTDKYLLATGTPSFDESGQLHLVVVNERDLTQLNAIQEKLEQSRMVAEKIKDQLAGLSMQELKEQNIVADSVQMHKILETALKLSRIEASNILILGESGTGKGLLAKFIHQHSRRCRKPFIQINCAALPENLLEAELFGYERGAFTGAREKGKIGLFELAQDGTLFLDEIGDLPLALQAKLLKYLDDHEILRLGGTRTHRIDCTVIAATNRDLGRRVGRRLFRRDLFYRLNTFTLSIPSLKDRPEDIFELINHFLQRYNRRYGTAKQITPAGLEILQAHDFPGNVRELKNIIKKAVVMSEQRVLDDFIARSLKAVYTTAPAAVARGSTQKPLNEELRRIEKRLLKDAMRQCQTTRQLASELGVSQPTVVRKMKRHGLSFALIQT